MKAILTLVKRVLGDDVLAVGGTAVHSTRTRSPMAPEAIKVAADFVALAVADVVFSIGSSSFSGNAAALNMGETLGHIGHVSRPLRRDEIQAVLASFLDVESWQKND